MINYILSIVNTFFINISSIFDNLNLGSDILKLIANDYEPNEVMKIIREWTGLTQTEFAKTLNRSRDSINNLENNRNKIYFNTLMEIAKIHGLTITIEKKK